MDLNHYTLPQLQQLGARIAKEIARQEAASKATVLKKLRRLAREHGVSLEEVVNSAAPAPMTPAAAPRSSENRMPTLRAKYRHPSNSQLAWSGRGRKPRWVEAWLAHGGSLDALETAAEKFDKRSGRKALSAPIEVSDVSAAATA